MPNPVPSIDKAAPESAGTAPPLSLDRLRAAIDAIDDNLQDLVIRRADLVEAVAQFKRAGNVAPIRPGREAQILRRLAARHRGRFPVPILIRMWREMLSGTVGMQADIAVAVPEQADPGVWDLARDHYGSQTRMLPCRGSAPVIAAVAGGRATVGILPLPRGQGDDPWWRLLAPMGEPGAHVIARLPFAAPGNARGAREALVVAALDPEPSGADVTVIALEAKAASELGAIAVALGATNSFAADFSATSGSSCLVGIPGVIEAADPSLRRALAGHGDAIRATAVLGLYACPLAAPRDGQALE